MAPGKKPNSVVKSKQKSVVKYSKRSVNKSPNDNKPDVSNYDEMSDINHEEEPYTETELSVMRGLSVNSDSEHDFDSDSENESESSYKVDSYLDGLFLKIEIVELLLSSKIVFKKDLQKEPVDFGIVDDLDNLLE